MGENNDQDFGNCWVYAEIHHPNLPIHASDTEAAISGHGAVFVERGGK